MSTVEHEPGVDVSAESTAPDVPQGKAAEREVRYVRGLALYGPAAFVGLSKIRETSTFGGVPIAAERERLRCGLAVVDLYAGQTVATFEFQSGVDELFDVQVLPNVTFPALSGPHAHLEGGSVWAVPRNLF